MPEYIAFPKVHDHQYVLDSDPATYPRRTTAEQARQDVSDAWHKPGMDRHAQQFVVYRVDGETVRPLKVEVHRKTEVSA